MPRWLTAVFIGLWDGFETSLAEDGKVEKKNMLGNIQYCIREIKTLQAFRFLEKFVGQYGVQGVGTYLGMDNYT